MFDDKKSSSLNLKHISSTRNWAAHLNFFSCEFAVYFSFFGISLKSGGIDFRKVSQVNSNTNLINDFSL